MTKYRLKAPNLGVYINAHEIEKVSHQLEKVAHEEGNEELESLAKHLTETLDDMLKLCWASDKSDAASVQLRKDLLDKYKHNIPEVLEETSDSDPLGFTLERNEDERPKSGSNDTPS